MRFSRLGYLLASIPILLVLWIAAHLPIYTDEIGYKMELGRLAVDGVAVASLYPQCRPVGEAAVDHPVSMLPTRMVDSFFYANLQPIWKLRALGLANFLLFLLVLAAFCARISLFTGMRFRERIFWAFGLVSWGVLPLMLVMNRPEQPLLLGLALVFTCARGDRFGRSWLLRALVLGVVPLFLLYPYHAKSLFFLPFLLVAIALCGKSIWEKSFLVAVNAFGAGFSYLFFGRLLSCPDGPDMQAYFNRHTLLPADIFSSPERFWSQGWFNLENMVDYLLSLEFRKVYMSDWLPPGTLGQGELLLNQWMEIVAVVAACGFLFAMLWALLRGPKVAPIGKIALPLSLVGGLLAVAFFQTVKNSYETALLFPLATLVCLSLFPPALRPLWRRMFLACLLIFALANQAVLVRRFLPYARSVWASESILPDQPHSLGIFRGEEWEKMVLATAEACSIQLNEENNRLVVDHSVYPVFSSRISPVSLEYWKGEWGKDIKNSAAFLRQLRVRGVVAQCESLPQELLPLAQRTGALCCVPELGAE